jgi:hypothetical protein
MRFLPRNAELRAISARRKGRGVSGQNARCAQPNADLLKGFAVTARGRVARSCAVLLRTSWTGPPCAGRTESECHGDQVCRGGSSPARRSGLLGWRRRDLSAAAQLHPNAVGYWEKRRAIPAGVFSEPHACKRMREALESAGIQFVTDPGPGAALRRVSAGTSAAIENPKA